MEDYNNLRRKEKGIKFWRKGTIEIQKERRTAEHRCPNVSVEVYRPKKFSDR